MKNKKVNKFGKAMSIPKGNGQNGGKQPKPFKPYNGGKK